MFDNIHIETERLILRNFRPSDTEAFQAILAKEEVMHFLPESVMSLDETRHIIDWYQDTYIKNTPDKILKWTLAVCLKDVSRGNQLTDVDPRLRGDDREGDDREGDDGDAGVGLKPSGKVIGWSGVGPLEFDESQTELFYGIDSAHWSQGFATEASRAVLEYAFGIIGLKRIVAVVKPDNVASVRVAEKLAFKFEKTLTGLGEKFANDEGSGLYYLTPDLFM